MISCVELVQMEHDPVSLFANSLRHLLSVAIDFEKLALAVDNEHRMVS